jgi:acyl transferase domain-containing protein
LAFSRLSFNLHLGQLNPQLPLAGTTFLIPTTVHLWPVHDGPRRVGVSPFGFGGANAHLILESSPVPVRVGDEVPPSDLRPASLAQSERPHEPSLLPSSVLCLSARSTQALQELARRYAQDLDERTWRSLAATPTDNAEKAKLRHPCFWASFIHAGKRTNLEDQP